MEDDGSLELDVSADDRIAVIGPGEAGGGAFGRGFYRVPRSGSPTEDKQCEGVI
ncbi:hypothetical protein SALBM135S_09770 [Streptomyces alboniger]